MLSKNLLDILACPLCKGPLVFSKTTEELLCKPDHLAYAIRDDIPVMVIDEARRLTSEELEQLS